MPKTERDQAAETLVKLLQDPDPSIRLNAAKLLLEFSS